MEPTIIYGQDHGSTIRPSPLMQADKAFPAFSYTEFLAATFDRSRHCTEPVRLVGDFSRMEGRWSFFLIRGL